MYSAIQELFYGSYSASDPPTSNVPGYRESLRHTIELSEQLRAGLSQEQKELFEAYCENANAGHALMGEAYFAQGVFPGGAAAAGGPPRAPAQLTTYHTGSPAGRWAPPPGWRSPRFWHWPPPGT